MKKILTILVVLILISAGYLGMVKAYPLEQEKKMELVEKEILPRGMDIYVPDDHPTIRSAVENASFGDNVIVRNGTYYEKNIPIDITLNLTSEYGYQNCIIDADDYGTSGISGLIVNADWVNISGFTIQNLGGSYGTSSSDAGIELNIVNNVTVANNLIRWSVAGGVFLEDTKDATITNNIFDGHRRGIHLVANNDHNERNTVINNTVKHCENGLYLRETDPERVIYSSFANNHFYECGAGGFQAILDDSSLNHHNEFVDNIINNSDNGIKIKSAQSNNLISNNTIYDINGYGIQLGAGISNQGPGPLVRDNHLLNASEGIEIVSYNHDSRIYNNLIEGCRDVGIYLGNTNSHDHRIENNTISNCYNGIELGSGDSHVIKNNTISQSIQYGIFEDSVGSGDCQNFIIADNEIKDSQSYGIYLDDPDIGGHLIYSNVFIYNNQGGVQANDSTSGTNLWDNGTHGNFWSDFPVRYPNAYPIGRIWNRNYNLDGSADINDTKPMATRSPAPVHNIDTGENFTAIQDAIDDTDTQDGHTIEVEMGFYFENVVLDKNLTINGEGYDITQINGNGTGSPLTINADWVNVTGFNLTNSPQDGINIANCENTYLSDLMITMNQWNGIYFENSQNLTVDGCSIIDNGLDGNNRAAILCDRTDVVPHSNISVLNSLLDDNDEYGIYITGSYYPMMTKGTVLFSHTDVANFSDRVFYAFGGGVNDDLPDLNLRFDNGTYTPLGDGNAMGLIYHPNELRSFEIDDVVEGNPTVISESSSVRIGDTGVGIRHHVKITDFRTFNHWSGVKIRTTEPLTNSVAMDFRNVSISDMSGDGGAGGFGFNLHIETGGWVNMTNIKVNNVTDSPARGISINYGEFSPYYGVDVNLSDVWVNDTTLLGGNAYGILYHGAGHFVMDNVTVFNTNPGWGGHAVQLRGNGTCEIMNSNISHNSNAAISFSTEYGRSEIHHSEFYKNGAYSGGSYAIYAEEVEPFIFHNNTMIRNFGGGLDLDPSTKMGNITIKDCLFENNTYLDNREIDVRASSARGTFIIERTDILNFSESAIFANGDRPYTDIILRNMTIKPLNGSTPFRHPFYFNGEFNNMTVENVDIGHPDHYVPNRIAFYIYGDFNDVYMRDVNIQNYYTGIYMYTNLPNASAALNNVDIMDCRQSGIQADFRQHGWINITQVNIIDLEGSSNSYGLNLEDNSNDPPTVNIDGFSLVNMTVGTGIGNRFASGSVFRNVNILNISSPTYSTGIEINDCQLDQVFFYDLNIGKVETAFYTLNGNIDDCRIYNGTFSDIGQYNFDINDPHNITVVNVTHNRSMAHDLHLDANLTIGWFYNSRVLQSVPRPNILQGAYVNFTSNNSVYQLNELTNVNGRSDWNIIWDSSYGSWEYDYNPYSIHVEHGGIGRTYTDENVISYNDRDFYIYTSQPPTSQITSSSSYWISGDIDIDWSASDNQQLESIDLEYCFSTDNSTWGNWTQFDNDVLSGTSDTGTSTFTFSDGEGYYRLRTIATDAGGYIETDLNDEQQNGLDTQPPTSSVDPITQYWNIDSPLEITGTANDGPGDIDHVILWYRYSSDNSSWGSWDQYDTDGSPSNGVSWNFDFPDGEGYYEFYSLAEDKAGNQEGGKTTSESECALDNQNPTLIIDSPSDGQVIDTDSIEVSWTASDNTSGIAEYSVALDSGDWIDVGTSTSYQFTSVSDGDHDISVRAVDNAGNTVSESITVSVDTTPDDSTPPSITILSPDEGEVLGTSDVTIEWTGDDSGTGIDHYEINYDNSQWIGLGTDTSDVSNLLDGEHTVHVRAVDNAGNHKETQVNFTIDTESPIIEITSPIEDEVIEDDSVTVQWDASDNTTDFTTVIRIDGGNWTTTTSGSYLFTELNNGEHTVEVRVTDEAGNQNTDSVTFTVDVQDDEEEELEEEQGFPWYLLLLPVVIVLLLLVIFFAKKRSEKEERPPEEFAEEEEFEEPEEPLNEEEQFGGDEPLDEPIEDEEL